MKPCESFERVCVLACDNNEDRFITSSANNVPRITSLLHKLLDHYSPILLTLSHPTSLSGQLERDSTATAIDGSELMSIGPNEVPLETGSTAYRLFPPPSKLADDPQLDLTLRTLGFGYRAGFIVNSLALLITEHGCPGLGECEVDGSRDCNGVEAFLRRLRSVPEAEWRNELIRLKGVGRKVADCIGLMSMDRVSPARVT
jgi:N-glycosylase/DNA lyase